MQIRRIKEINNVGAYANFTNGSSFGFEKLTFIYGLNTFGKTTLADIFQSLKTNDGTIIENRKTIPDIGTSQNIKINYRRKGTTESQITFNSGVWQANNIAQHIEVFGSDFMDRNVFTGLSIERRNKENLTNFILGDQGVKLAEQIKETKKTIGEKKKELKDKLPQFVKTFSDEGIKKFIEYDILGLNPKRLVLELTIKKQLLLKEEDRLKEPKKITEMREPEHFNNSVPNVEETINTINILLEKNYNDIKEESIQKLNNHVGNNFANFDKSKIWIHQGLEYCKDKNNGNCPFCGQDLTNARQLIELYSSYFNKAYTNYISETSSGLKINFNKLYNFKFNHQLELHSLLLIINQYKELIQDEIFSKKLSEFENIVIKLNEGEIENEKSRIISLAELKIEEKNLSPYKNVEPIGMEELKKLVEEYAKSLSKCHELIEYFISEITLFKNKYKNIETIKATILKLNEEISKLEYKKSRIEQNNECEEFKALQKNIDKLENGEEGVNKLEEKLQQDQTDFLDKYFDTINPLFRKFGSKNFTLKKREENKGHMPVYSLLVEFHNKEIPSNKICTIFSTSDRRALALAIFFARFELKEEDEKNKTVIILDDPVTSFDDNRTTNSINYFVEVLNKISQLIILTHYVHFIKRFCEITKINNSTFINIKQNNYTSYLEKADKKELLISDYNKIFMKIYDFINKKHTDSIKSDLRPFLENFYLPNIFCKQIRDKQVDCSSLNNMIEGIFNDNEEAKNKFHTFRRTTNPDSHIFTNNNEEDVRNFAEEMFEYIFSIKIN